MYCSIADILRFHEINISSVIVRVRSIKSSFAAAFYRLTNRRHLSKDPFCYVIFCRIAASDVPKPEDYRIEDWHDKNEAIYVCRICLSKLTKGLMDDIDAKRLRTSVDPLSIVNNIPINI